jgi:hypothetical protein
MLDHERLQLGYDLALAAAAEVGLSSILKHLQAQFLKPLRLAPQRFRAETCERRAPPQGKRIHKQLRRPLAIPRSEGRPPLLRIPLELAHV